MTPPLLLVTYNCNKQSAFDLKVYLKNNQEAGKQSTVKMTCLAQRNIIPLLIALSYITIHYSHILYIILNTKMKLR